MGNPGSDMPATDSQTAKLNRYGVRELVSLWFETAIGLVALFLSAGTVKWVNGWVLCGLTLAYLIVSAVVFVKLNPEMLNERGKFYKKGTKAFDWVWPVAYLVLLFGAVILCGLDAVRYKWTAMPFWLSALGVVLFIAGIALGTWAMAVNPFFECSVRIQDDRGQNVIQSGPYGLIRHPGYAGGAMSWLAEPLVLGSWWGLVPMGFLVIILVIRTALEDRTLREELTGYQEYTRKTRYRLIPFVW